MISSALYSESESRKVSYLVDSKIAPSRSSIVSKNDIQYSHSFRVSQVSSNDFENGLKTVLTKLRDLKSSRS